MAMQVEIWTVMLLMMITQTRVQVSDTVSSTSSDFNIGNPKYYVKVLKLSQSKNIKWTNKEWTGIIDLLDLSRSFRQTREMVNTGLYNNNPYLSLLFCKKSPCQLYTYNGIHQVTWVQGSNWNTRNWIMSNLSTSTTQIQLLRLKLNH